MAQREQVIVTGAGSGIGKEFTKLFLADGAKVLAVSLVPDELEQLKIELEPYGDNLVTRTQDLAEPDAAEDLVAYCHQEAWLIDTLVNNAGFACFGEVVELNLAKVERMIRLNVITMTKLSAMFGAKMKERRSGNILNVGSTAGMLPAPRFGTYSAAKAYVNTFTFSFRQEMKPYGVNVTCLTPGMVATNFARAAEIHTFAGKSLLKEMFTTGKISTPAEVAAAGYRGLRAGKAHVVAGKGAWMAAILSHLLPHSIIPVLTKDT